MSVHKAGLLLLAALCAAQAQGTESVRRATINGSRGTSGKCTIEVRVDIAAEVDISGDSGRLRTIAGQPATWTRMECSDPLPSQMSDFRFKGVDGRGQMRLVQDPRNNNSVAIIRIDDSKSGSEGYTFDIEWSGASGGAPNGFETRSVPGLPSTTRGPIRGSNRRISDEQAVDACRAELRDRATRDYGLRNIDVAAAQARGEEVTGTFNEGNALFRRGNAAPYRFTCSVDYNSGQVRSLEIVRPDGSRLERAEARAGEGIRRALYVRARTRWSRGPIGTATRTSTSHRPRWIHAAATRSPAA